MGFVLWGLDQVRLFFGRSLLFRILLPDTHVHEHVPRPLLLQGLFISLLFAGADGVYVLFLVLLRTEGIVFFITGTDGIHSFIAVPLHVKRIICQRLSFFQTDKEHGRQLMKRITIYLPGFNALLLSFQSPLEIVVFL